MLCSSLFSVGVRTAALEVGVFVRRLWYLSRDSYNTAGQELVDKDLLVYIPFENVGRSNRVAVWAESENSKFFFVGGRPTGVQVVKSGV